MLASILRPGTTILLLIFIFFGIWMDLTDETLNISKMMRLNVPSGIPLAMWISDTLRSLPYGPRTPGSLSSQSPYTSVSVLAFNDTCRHTRRCFIKLLYSIIQSTCWSCVSGTVSTHSLLDALSNMLVVAPQVVLMDLCLWKTIFPCVLIKTVWRMTSPDRL